MSETTNMPADVRVRETIDGYIAQGAEAIDPYVMRLSMQLAEQGTMQAIRDSVPEGLLERIGVTEDQLNEKLEEGMRAAPVSGAVTELLLDLMHLCKREGIDMRDSLELATRRYSSEMDMAAKVLIYGDPEFPVDILRDHPQVAVAVREDNI